ncbi:TetR/AcrR family transcriptional regulator [soil metagenome]
MEPVSWFGPDSSTRTRVLTATVAVIGRRGRSRLNLSDVAAEAGISRPTLYRLFASKGELLDALGQHEMAAVHAAVSAALQGLSGPARLDALLQFIVEFQQSYPLRHLIEIEPTHELRELKRVLPIARSWVREEIHEAEDADLLAGAIVRIALSHFLVPDNDRADFLAQLRRAAGIPTGTAGDDTEARML